MAKIDDFTSFQTFLKIVPWLISQKHGNKTLCTLVWLMFLPRFQDNNSNWSNVNHHANLICWVNKNCAVNSITASQFWRQKFEFKKSQDLSQIPIKMMWSRNFSAFAIKTTLTNFATDKQIKALKNHEINKTTILNGHFK